MNVYQKLNLARVKLQNSELKKTGKNKHLGFEYFELADFLQVINEINNEIGICVAFKVFDAKAELHVFNAEKPDEVIVFESPTAHAKLQGNASAIQELGSQHTYMRRYLYLMAYEIIESDCQDAQVSNDKPRNTPQQEKPNQTNKLSDAQLGRLYAIASKKGHDKNSVIERVKKSFNCEPADMTKAQYEKAVASYEAMPDVAK